MEINNNYLRKAEVSAKKHNQEIVNETAQAAQESQEYCKGVNFTGLGSLRTFSIKALKWGRKAKPIEFPKDFKTHIKQYERYCSTPVEEFQEAAKEENLTSPSSLDFLHAMMQRAVNYGIPHEAKTGKSIDAKEPIMELFRRVKEPNGGHIQFVEQSQLSMENIKKCFDICEDNPKKLEKIGYIINSLGRGLKTTDEVRVQITEDFLNSKNVREYVDNYRNYSEYINKHSGEADLVKMLDRSIENQSVVKDTRAKTVETVLKDMPKTDNFQAKRFLPYYSEDGNKLLEELNMRFSKLEKTNPEAVSDGYVQIYKTTTPQNSDFRQMFLDRNYEITQHQTADLPADEVTNLSKLFDYLDKDPHARSFVEASMKKSDAAHDKYAMLQSAGDYLELFEKYDSRDLAKNSFGVVRAIERGFTDKLGSVDEYMVPILEAKEKSIGAFFKRLIGRTEEPPMKPSQFQDFAEISKPVEKVVPTPVTPKKVKKTTSTPVSQKDTLPKDYLANANAKYLADLIKNTPSDTTIGKKLKLTKESVTPVLNKYIKSDRVRNEQERVYAEKATKMRASMLPDIFESIKVTRAEAKAANGGKLPKGFVTAEDALQLYTRINGKNKKLVKYMLEQTKVNKEGKKVRAFTVNDIVTKLDDANKQIFSARAAATKENKFTAKDEKAIYDKMFKDLTDQYGKSQKAPRTKKVAKAKKAEAKPTTDAAKTTKKVNHRTPANNWAAQNPLS